MDFMSSLQNTLGEEFNNSVTENGAVGYKTTGKYLLDMNFKISSYRGVSEEDIATEFWKAYYENPLLAIKWLFFASDVRGGAGERRLFKVCFKELCKMKPAIAVKLLKIIPEYSRWDNMLVGIDFKEVRPEIFSIIKEQLTTDMNDMAKNKPISLLAKWLPSENASSRESRRLAESICHGIGITTKTYRKMLSKLRKYLNLVEIKISNGEWSAIDYSAVPSRANLMYNSAFLKHDEERRREFLGALSEGKVKINAGTLFPSDIVHQYRKLQRFDQGLEGLWKNLPDYVNGDNTTLCVIDGSGSMIYNKVSKSNVPCLDIAQGIGIYFAERCSGQFKNSFITFSEHPQLINISSANTLADKINLVSRFNECANTNIEAVFDLILMTALKHKMGQEQMPKNILILSDMEFDECAVQGPPNHHTSVYPNFSTITRRNFVPADAKLFNVIKQRFEAAGYKLPRLVFWNIYSRSCTVPIKENEMGVGLVSGFSPAILKMVLNGKLDPYENLVETLQDERYNLVEETLKDVKEY